MPDQFQCPNCGGYKITSQSTPIKQRVALSEAELKAEKQGGICMIIIFLIPSLVLTMVSVVLSLFSENAIWDTVGSFSALAFIFFLGAVVYAFNRRTKTKEVGKQYSFDCLLCGYRWQWRAGDPWPTVRVNPELIVKGEQRLEEEKRRREEEAALYQVSKLGKK